MKHLLRITGLAVLIGFAQIDVSKAACDAEFEVINGAMLESNDTIYTCVNIPLQFDDISLLEGALTQRKWDFGDGSPIIIELLSSVTSHTYNTEGTYTLTLTVSSILCTEMTTTKTIVVLGQPEFGLAMQDVDCFSNCNGMGAVIILGDNANYYNVEWSDPLMQQNDTAFNLCAGTYNGVITDDFGCTDLLAGPVDIFEPQEFLVNIDNGDTIYLCPSNGDQAVTLSMAGGNGNNQTWWNTSVGMTLQTVEVSMFSPSIQTLDQMYYLTAQDGNGCQATDSVYIMSAPSSLEGNVSIAGSPCEGCEVYRYHYDASPGLWHVIEADVTDNLGHYNFGSIDNYEDFIIMADPDDISYPMTMQTFYPQEYLWDSAFVFNVCGAQLQKNIEVIPPMNFNGTNTLSGTVFYDPSGKTQTEEDPIPLIDVVVEKTPPGAAMGQTNTDINGEFTFEYVPSSDTMYTLYINLPGVPQTSTYEIIASASGQLFDNLDFCLNIDSTEVYTCFENNEIVGQTPDETGKSGFVVYPNPAKSRFVIETGVFADAAADLRIVDLTGRVIFNKRYAETPYVVNMVNIAQGHYLVQLYNDEKLESVRITVVD